MDWTAFWLFTCITLVIVYFGYQRHKERMEMIKLGINPVKIIHPGTGGRTLFLGLLGVAAGLAFLIVYLTQYDRHFSQVKLTFGLLFLFGGASFLLYWKLTAGDRERALKAYEQSLAALNEDIQKKEHKAENQVNEPPKVEE